MPNLKDITGQRFTRLVAERLDHVNIRAYWFCRCDCGRSAVVKGASLRGGNTRSCGCLRRELLEERRAAGRIGNITHKETRGGNRTVEYVTWMSMIQRCTNPKHISFPYYGGRGIGVCAAWRNSFEQFLADMGRRPRGRTLDRTDNIKGYGPDNCRWATPKEQRKNQNPRRKP